MKQKNKEKRDSKKLNFHRRNIPYYSKRLNNFRKLSLKNNV